MLLFLLLVRVAADGDDADRGAGGVWNDNGLPLPLPGGAGGAVAPAACDGGAAGRAAVHQGAAGRRVLLDALGPLRGAEGLGGGHLTGGDVSVTTKPHTLREEGQPSGIFLGANCLEVPALPDLHRKVRAQGTGTSLSLRKWQPPRGFWFSSMCLLPAGQREQPGLRTGGIVPTDWAGLVESHVVPRI